MDFRLDPQPPDIMEQMHFELEVEPPNIIHPPDKRESNLDSSMDPAHRTFQSPVMFAPPLSSLSGDYDGHDFSTTVPASTLLPSTEQSESLSGVFPSSTYLTYPSSDYYGEINEFQALPLVDQNQGPGTPQVQPNFQYYGNNFSLPHNGLGAANTFIDQGPTCEAGFIESSVLAPRVQTDSQVA